MSQGTNSERITQNNAKIDVIKQKASTLPESDLKNMGLIFTTQYQVDLLDSNEKYVDVLVPKSFDVTDMVYGANIYTRWNAGDVWMMNLNSGIQRIEFHEGNEYNYYRIVYNIWTTSPIYTKIQVVFAKTGYQTAISDIYINPLPFTYGKVSLSIYSQNGNSIPATTLTKSNLYITDENEEPFDDYSLVEGTNPAYYVCKLPVGTWNISFRYDNVEQGSYTKTITQEEINTGLNVSDSLYLNSNPYVITGDGYIQDVITGSYSAEQAPLDWQLTFYDANDDVISQKTVQKSINLNVLGFGDISRATLIASFRNCETQTISISDYYSGNVFVPISANKGILKYVFYNNETNQKIYLDENTQFTLINYSTSEDVYSTSHIWYNGDLYLFVDSDINYNFSLPGQQGYDTFNYGIYCESGSFYPSTIYLIPAVPKATVVFNLYNLENQKISFTDYNDQLSRFLTSPTIGNDLSEDSDGNLILTTKTTATENILYLNVGATYYLEIPYSVTASNIENYETVQKNITLPVSSLYPIVCIDMKYVANEMVDLNSGIGDMIPSISYRIDNTSTTVQVQHLYNLWYAILDTTLVQPETIFITIADNEVSIDGVVYHYHSNGEFTININSSFDYNYYNIPLSVNVFLPNTAFFNPALILDNNGSTSTIDEYEYKTEVYRNNVLEFTGYLSYNLLNLEAMLNDVIECRVYRNVGTLETPEWYQSYWSSDFTVGAGNLYLNWSFTAFEYDIPSPAPTGYTLTNMRQNTITYNINEGTQIPEYSDTLMAGFTTPTSSYDLGYPSDVRVYDSNGNDVSQDLDVTTFIDDEDENDHWSHYIWMELGSGMTFDTAGTYNYTVTFRSPNTVPTTFNVPMVVNVASITPTTEFTLYDIRQQAMPLSVEKDEGQSGNPDFVTARFDVPAGDTSTPNITMTIYDGNNNDVTSQFNTEIFYDTSGGTPEIDRNFVDVFFYSVTSQIYSQPVGVYNYTATFTGTDTNPVSFNVPIQVTIVQST